MLSSDQFNKSNDKDKVQTFSSKQRNFLQNHKIYQQKLAENDYYQNLVKNLRAKIQQQEENLQKKQQQWYIQKIELMQKIKSIEDQRKRESANHIDFIIKQNQKKQMVEKVSVISKQVSIQTQQIKIEKQNHSQILEKNFFWCKEKIK